MSAAFRALRRPMLVALVGGTEDGEAQTYGARFAVPAESSTANLGHIDEAPSPEATRSNGAPGSQPQRRRRPVDRPARGRRSGARRPAPGRRRVVGFVTVTKLVKCQHCR